MTHVPCSCTNCGTSKFGLVRYNHFSRVFCSSKCKTLYYEGQAQKLRESRRRWLEYLHPNSFMCR